MERGVVWEVGVALEVGGDCAAGVVFKLVDGF